MVIVFAALMSFAISLPLRIYERRFIKEMQDEMDRIKLLSNIMSLLGALSLNNFMQLRVHNSFIDAELMNLYHPAYYLNIFTSIRLIEFLVW